MPTWHTILHKLDNDIEILLICRRMNNNKNPLLNAYCLYRLDFIFSVANLLKMYICMYVRINGANKFV